MSTVRSSELSATDQVARAQRRLTSLRRPAEEDASDFPRILDAAEIETPPTADDRGLSLSVRSVRLGDLPRVARMSPIERMNQPEIALTRYSAMRSSMRSLMPGGGSRPRVFVAAAEDRIVGFAHFQPAFSDRRWHAIAIGTGTGVYDAAPVEDALIRHGVTAAGLRGVKRLYARIESGSDLVNSFARLGFAAYATETIFVADGALNLGRAIAVRRQEQTDTWAIHQLYNATVPKTVQYAEALTSHRWDLRGLDELARSTKRLGWLVDDGHAVAAYGRVTCGQQAHAIELLYQPERTDALGGLIDSILQELRSSSSVRRIYCTLRGYQVEAAKEFESRGFEPVLEQDLHVKYTTATVRAPQSEPLTLNAEVIERLPKRVPSFLRQKHQDEVANRSRP